MGERANRIAEIRFMRGLSQAALATLCGTSNQQISRLEAGKRELTLSWMARLARALRCSPVELLPVEFTNDARTIGERPGDDGDGQPFRYLKKHRVEVPSWPIPVWDNSDSLSPYGCIHFGEGFLRKYDINPIDCEIVAVQDNSMVPTLPAGCACLIDRRKTELIDGALYAVASEDALLIRRAVRREGEWTLQADDPTKPLLVGSHKVIGFVLWVGGIGPRSEHWEVPEEERMPRAAQVRAAARSGNKI